MSFLWKIKKEIPGANVGDLVEADYEGFIFGVQPESYPDFFEYVGIPYLYCSLCSEQIGETHREEDGRIVYEHLCKTIVRPPPEKYLEKPFCYNCASYHEEVKLCTRKSALPRWQRKSIIEKNGRLVPVWEAEPENK